MVRMLGFPPAREVLSESGVFTSQIDRRHRGVSGADAVAQARLEAAFAREERRELMVASATRTADGGGDPGLARAVDARTGPRLRVGARHGVHFSGHRTRPALGVPAGMGAVGDALRVHAGRFA